LVGGLAVTARIATVHRVTNDVDVVVDEPVDDALAAVADDHAARVEIEGVKVDVMATSPLPVSAADLPDDDHDRLFVLGHRWALDTATALPIVVRGPDVTECSLIAATAPALFACKLHAIDDRRDARADKRESDARDIYRLAQLLVRTPELVEPLRTAPFDLTALLAERVRRWFVDDVTRTARLMAVSRGVGEEPVAPQELAALGRLLLATVSPAVTDNGAIDGLARGGA
jgi:hypothetical protein